MYSILISDMMISLYTDKRLNLFFYINWPCYLVGALDDFENIPSCKSPAKKSEPAKTKDSESCPSHTQEPSLDNWGLSESDIEATAAEFEKSMKEIFSDDNELLKQWNEFAEKAAFTNPGAYFPYVSIAIIFYGTFTVIK